MFWLFIPAIYFYIGPCFGLLNNLAPCRMRNMFIAISLLVANILNLIVAPWVVGLLSDWFAGPRPTDAASLRAALLVLAPTGLWAAYHLYCGIKNHHRRSEARNRLYKSLGTLGSMTNSHLDRRWLPLNALRAFEGVAKHSSFTAAANALLISQSALSRHVIALEKLIGAQLFERRPHALVLDQGRPAFAAGRHEVLRSAGIRAGRFAQRRRDRHAYAAGADAAELCRAYLAVPILRDFRRAVAEVEIDLVSPHGVGPPPGDVDVAVVYSKPTVTDLVTDLLWPVHLSLLCHPNCRRAACAARLWREFIAANELVHVRIADLPRHHLWTQFARAAQFDRAECRARTGFRYRDAGRAIRAERRGHRAARYLSVRRLHSYRAPGQAIRATAWMTATATI